MKKLLVLAALGVAIAIRVFTKKDNRTTKEDDGHYQFISDILNVHGIPNVPLEDHIQYNCSSENDIKKLMPTIASELSRKFGYMKVGFIGEDGKLSLLD